MQYFVFLPAIVVQESSRRRDNFDRFSGERCVVRFRLLIHSFRDQDMRASFSVTKHRNQHLVGPSQPALRVPSGTGKSMSAASKYFFVCYSTARPRSKGRGGC